MWYSGIDQHQRDSVLTTYGPSGPRVKQARVPNSPLALQPRGVSQFNVATVVELGECYQLQARCHTAQIELLVLVPDE